MTFFYQKIYLNFRLHITMQLIYREKNTRMIIKNVIKL